MSSYGHIRLPKSLLKDKLWKSLSYQYRHIFMTILENMAFKETEMDDFGVLTIVKPFQLLTTKAELTKLCNEDDINESMVYRFILKAKVIKLANHQTNHRKTLITVIREDILRECEPRFEPAIEPNSNQTRTINKTDKKESFINLKEQPQTPKNAVVVFSCLEKIQDPSIDDKVKARITQKYQAEEQRIIDAVDAISHPSFYPRESLLKSLNAAIKDKWKPPVDKDEFINLNKKLAKELEAKGHHCYTVEACTTYLLIHGGQISDPIEYDMPYQKFIERIEKRLKIKGVKQA